MPPTDPLTRAAEAEAAMRNIALEAGLGEPDEVEHDLENDELVFTWEEQKLAVIGELGD